MPRDVRSTQHYFPRYLSRLLLALVLLYGCGKSTSPATSPSSPSSDVDLGPLVIPVANPDLSGDSSRQYLSALNLMPQKAERFELVNNAIPLNDQELSLLARNGFVVSEHNQWQRFSHAYAWIYWKDLPVLVTTDSILHAVHQSYSDLLADVEEKILMPQLATILSATRAEMSAEAKANSAPALTVGYEQVESYLAVAQALLEGRNGDSASEQEWVGQANAANGVSDVNLFGATYTVDFTIFQPRGRYTQSETLGRYFRAMSWLAKIDFRLVTYDAETNQPVLNSEAIADVAILRAALDHVGERADWLSFNNLFDALIGRSDNMTLVDFDRFWSDMGFHDPGDVSAIAPDSLLNQLTQHDYGQQRITGQVLTRSITNRSNQPELRPISFALLGQRFSIDSYVLGNVVYDRLKVDGKLVERALPSPLDAMYALGNERAVTHLSAELERYQYGGYLAALRQQIDGLDSSYWTNSVYNGWLGLIRSLNKPTLDARYPEAMRTAAWADKTLQTQLASWAQLRHDNILYVKQSYTTFQALCEYPAGYVEPYPAFYTALSTYAQAEQQALTQLDSASLTADGKDVRKHVLAYFDGVRAVAGPLQILAEKELQHEPFTDTETAFLKGIIKRQVIVGSGGGCAGPSVAELWDGWYMSLFYSGDDTPAVVADVHTNPNNDPQSGLYPPGVLHVATGPATPLFFLVDSDAGTALYVGPAFSYFETVENGYPPKRLTDEEWRTRLTAADYPQPPAWTSTFRLPSITPPQLLALDRMQDVGNNSPLAQPGSAAGRTENAGDNEVPQPWSPLTFP